VLWALLAVLVPASPGHALHGAEHQKSPTPTGSAVGKPLPPAPPLDSSAPPGPADPPQETSSSGVPTTGVLALRQLVAESTWVAEGVVARTDSLDEDRLRVYHLTVARTIKGEAGGPEAAIIEMRGGSSRPGLLADGTRAIVLLRPAPPLSYLTQHLPEGTHLALTGGRDGVIALANDADRRVVDHAIGEAIRIAAMTDPTESEAARRALAFAELETGHPRLAGDALVELRALGAVKTLTPEEVATLGRALGTRTIDSTTRTGLVQLAGQRPWAEAVPVLRTAVADSPNVLHALLTARARLGAPASKAELEAYLEAKDPAMRAAAIRALAGQEEPPIEQLGRFATGDGEVEVRVAAIEALGMTRRADAVPVLSKTFAESSRAVKQASARALLAIGGPATSEALTGLALRGADPDTRKYAALLLVMSTGRDSPAVQRLLASNPSGEVRKVIEHGLEFTHSHKHGAE
jgi:HEAT repeat protein